MDVLVTGGAGFIGSHFVEMLLSDPQISPSINRVVILDSLTYAADKARLRNVGNDKRLEFIEGNINNREEIVRLVPGKKFIFNFAAETHVDNSIKDPNPFIEANIRGVQNILNVLQHNLDTVLVQVSTDEVYGDCIGIPFIESDPINPSSPYSASKASAELLIAASSRTYGVQYRITRGSNTYGVFQYPEKVIPYFIKMCLEGGTLPVYGDGMQVREWIHVRDHCKGIWLAAINGKNAQAYNLGSGFRITNLELVKMILSLTHSNTSKIIHTTDRKGHDRRYAINSEKALRDLGFVADFTLEKTLPIILESYLSRES